MSGPGSTRRAAFAAVLLAALSGAACAEGTVLDPVTPQAGRIAGLWWFMLALGTLIYLLVLAAVAVPLWRSRRGAEPVDPGAPGGDEDADEPVRRRLIIAGGVVVPVLVVVTLVTLGSVVGRDVAPAAQDDDLVIEVVGHQFWWQVTYPDLGVVTANEIHIPTDRPVRLRLHASDVIHSFWVPALHGKIDLRPGAETALSFQADRAGTYRGRCAEYCGLSHAQMATLVIAQSPEEFEAWVREQAADAAEPDTPTRRTGQALFASSCAACHQVRGHTPDADLGPDLTHVASRRTLAAGTIPNTREDLRTWIRSPQAVKAGVAMPPADLDDEALEALLDYLEGLE